MAGGGSRRDEGSLVINNTNVFAALESLRKKKKSDKERKSKGSSKSQAAHVKESEPQLFWAPAPLNSKSWADVDDEDDDDYYATTAPPQAVWGSSDPQEIQERVSNVEESESESEEDILEEGDEDIEEEHVVFNELDVPVHHKPVAEKPPEASVVAKETERQLSKKERKKKELADLDALLANFIVNQNENSSQNESCDIEEEKRDIQEEKRDADLEKEHAPAESKSAKKKKKKERASKEVKELPNNSGLATELEEAAGNDGTEEDASAIDVKERLKKMATMKKKKSKKEIDSAAKVAAQEAAARTAKLAAAKKKEKSHYSQQPVVR